MDKMVQLNTVKIIQNIVKWKSHNQLEDIV